MKRLYILRHAHASIGVIDRERELDEQGIDELKSIGSQMITLGMRPNVILTSGARRSIETAKHIRELFGLLVNVIDIREDLYNADIAQIIKILQSLPDEKNSVMLITHQQSAIDLLGTITDAEYKEIPHGGLIVIELRLRHWKNLEDNSGRELTFLKPQITEVNLIENRL
jgi:phosphohistidine phosphatase